MTIDLTPYSTTAQINAAVAAALVPYVLTTTLGSYSTTAHMNTAITNALATYIATFAIHEFFWTDPKAKHVNKCDKHRIKAIVVTGKQPKTITEKR